MRLYSLPSPSLLCDYSEASAELEAAAYRDAFELQVDQTVSLERFIEAFYTSWLFRLERRVLSVFLNASSSDQQAKQLAAGKLDRFSAWAVAERAHDEILLVDFSGATRSWLSVCSSQNHSTRLRFGSVLVSSSYLYRNALTLGLHRLYSRALLKAAVQHIARNSANTTE